MSGDLIERPRSVADILAAAADLIAPKGRWTQDDFARDDDGEPVDYTDPRAVCWCARGAIGAVASDRDIYAVWREAGVLLGFDDLSEIESWNDDSRRTQAEVVAALRAAADKARTAASSSSPGTVQGGEK